NCASNLAFTCAHGRGSSDSPKASRAAFKSDAFSNASSSVKSSISDTTRLARESESVSSFEIASANSTLLTLQPCQSETQFQVRDQPGRDRSQSRRHACRYSTKEKRPAVAGRFELN